MADYFESVLWLPYVEPAVLCHHNAVAWPGPTFENESFEENLKLAKLWGSRGLLAFFEKPHPSGLFCKVFNAHKNELLDRQIGDRRWVNGSRPDLPQVSLQDQR